MLGISRFCASSLGSKSLYSRLPTQFNNVFVQSNQISRRIITSNHHTLKCGNYVKNYTVNTSRVQFKLSQTFKNASLIVARSLSSNAEVKKETSKAVGYWLLTCSGMVFVAVVLGTVTGYLVLLYSIYYVMGLIVSTTKNK